MGHSVVLLFGSFPFVAVRLLWCGSGSRPGLFGLALLAIHCRLVACQSWVGYLGAYLAGLAGVCLIVLFASSP